MASIDFIVRRPICDHCTSTRVGVLLGTDCGDRNSLGHRSHHRCSRREKSDIHMTNQRLEVMNLYSLCNCKCSFITSGAFWTISRMLDLAVHMSNVLRLIVEFNIMTILLL